MSSSEAPEQTPSANSSSAPEGLSAFTAKVLDQLSLSAWLPAAFVTLSGSIVIGFRANNGLNLTPLIAYVNDHPWTFGLLAVPTVVCLTLLTQAFSYEAIRLLEGYWRWPGPADWVRSLMVSWHTGRSRRIAARINVLGGRAFLAARDRWLKILDGNASVLAALQADAQGESRLPLSPEDEKIADQHDWKTHCSPARLRRIESLEKAAEDYPATHRTLPTMLGNILRTVEDDTQDEDIVSLVYRARDRVQLRVRLQHDQFRTRLDMYSILTVASLILSVTSAVVLAPIATDPPTAWGVAGVVGAFIAVSWLSYRAAIASARGYVVTVAEMAKQLRNSAFVRGEPSEQHA